MKTGLTEIVCVVDRSGSMSSIKDDAIGAFNTFLEEQKKVEGEARLTLTLFNHEYVIFDSGKDLKDVKPLNTDTYVPSGTTALLDALGRTIDEVGQRLKELPEEERPERVAVVVLTDGHENSSAEYTRDGVREQIKHQTEQYKWEFIFLAAGPDAFEEAGRLGFAEEKTSGYAAGDAAAHKSAARQMSGGMSRFRSGKKPDWKK